MKNLYLIDFDGTISNNDSFLSFTLFMLGILFTIKYWIIIGTLFPFRSKSDLKEMFYLNFKECDSNEFNLQCSKFIDLKLKKIY